MRLMMRRKRRGLDMDTRRAAAQKLAGHLLKLLRPHLPAILAAYQPIHTEIDCRPAMAALARAGAQLALPVCDAATETLSFHAWQDGDLLIPGAFGINEPGPDAPLVHPGIVLVPCLAFDRRGNRLGQGKGYYDKALSDLSRGGKPLSVGLAYSSQEVDAVPTEPHDQPLAYIVTEGGVLETGKETLS